jgi:hypothetical protein
MALGIAYVGAALELPLVAANSFHFHRIKSSTPKNNFEGVAATYHYGNEAEIKGSTKIPVRRLGGKATSEIKLENVTLLIDHEKAVAVRRQGKESWETSDKQQHRDGTLREKNFSLPTASGRFYLNPNLPLDYEHRDWPEKVTLLRQLIVSNRVFAGVNLIPYKFFFIQAKILSERTPHLLVAITNEIGAYTYMGQKNWNIAAEPSEPTAIDEERFSIATTFGQVNMMAQDLSIDNFVMNDAKNAEYLSPAPAGIDFLRETGFPLARYFSLF